MLKQSLVFTNVSTYSWESGQEVTNFLRIMSNLYQKMDVVIITCSYSSVSVSVHSVCSYNEWLGRGEVRKASDI